MVEARTRPRARTAVPARPGRRGPRWPARVGGGGRQRSAGQASSESGGAPAGGERAGASLPERGLGRGGAGGAAPWSCPSLPSPSQPCLSGSQRAPGPLPRRGRGSGRRKGDRVGTLGAGRTPEGASATLHRTLASPAFLSTPWGKAVERRLEGPDPRKGQGALLDFMSLSSIFDFISPTRLPTFCHRQSCVGI